MRCRSCGVDLPVDDAAFCSQCGARVELGSVLGVGTDLPSPPFRNALQPRRPATGGQSPGPTASAAPEDLSQTRELPRLDPAAASPMAVRPAATLTQATPTEPARAAAATDPAAPSRPPAAAGSGWAGSPEGPSPDEDGRARGHSRGSILAMVATFAALTIIGTFALTRLVGSDEPASSARASASSSPTQEESGDSPTASATAPSATASPSQEVSPSAPASIPAQARRCSTSGSDAVATAYAGTDRTSCEFAAAVREAYRSAGSPGGATSLRAYSPVTKKWYSLSCDGGEPVRCTTTTNAIVLLAP